LRQACRFIEPHLKEPDLSAHQICTALRISRATKYRMFEFYGGVASRIKERRLMRIHGLIALPSGSSWPLSSRIAKSQQSRFIFSRLMF